MSHLTWTWGRIYVWRGGGVGEWGAGIEGNVMKIALTYEILKEKVFQDRWVFRREQRHKLIVQFVVVVFKTISFLIENIFFSYNIFWLQFPSPSSSRLLPTSSPTQIHTLSFVFSLVSAFTYMHHPYDAFKICSYTSNAHTYEHFSFQIHTFA